MTHPSEKTPQDTDEVLVLDKIPTLGMLYPILPPLPPLGSRWMGFSGWVLLRQLQWGAIADLEAFGNIFQFWDFGASGQGSDIGWLYWQLMNGDAPNAFEFSDHLANNGSEAQQPFTQTSGFFAESISHAFKESSSVALGTERGDDRSSLKSVDPDPLLVVGEHQEPNSSALVSEPGNLRNFRSVESSNQEIEVHDESTAIAPSDHQALAESPPLDQQAESTFIHENRNLDPDINEANTLNFQGTLIEIPSSSTLDQEGSFSAQDLDTPTVLQANDQSRNPLWDNKIQPGNRSGEPIPEAISALSDPSQAKPASSENSTLAKDPTPENLDASDSETLSFSSASNTEPQDADSLEFQTRQRQLSEPSELVQHNQSDPARQQIHQPLNIDIQNAQGLDDGLAQSSKTFVSEDFSSDGMSLAHSEALALSIAEFSGAVTPDLLEEQLPSIEDTGVPLGKTTNSHSAATSSKLTAELTDSNLSAQNIEPETVDRSSKNARNVIAEALSNIEGDSETRQGQFSTASELSQPSPSNPTDEQTEPLLAFQNDLSQLSDKVFAEHSENVTSQDFQEDSTAHSELSINGDEEAAIRRSPVCLPENEHSSESKIEHSISDNALLTDQQAALDTLSTLDQASSELPSTDVEAALPVDVDTARQPSFPPDNADVGTQDRLVRPYKSADLSEPSLTQSFESKIAPESLQGDDALQTERKDLSSAQPVSNAVEPEGGLLSWLNRGVDWVKSKFESAEVEQDLAHQENSPQTASQVEAGIDAIGESKINPKAIHKPAKEEPADPSSATGDVDNAPQSIVKASEAVSPEDSFSTYPEERSQIFLSTPEDIFNRVSTKSSDQPSQDLATTSSPSSNLELQFSGAIAPENSSETLQAQSGAIQRPNNDLKSPNSSNTLEFTASGLSEEQDLETPLESLSIPIQRDAESLDQQVRVDTERTVSMDLEQSGQDALAFSETDRADALDPIHLSGNAKQTDVDALSDKQDIQVGQSVPSSNFTELGVEQLIGYQLQDAAGDGMSPLLKGDNSASQFSELTEAKAPHNAGQSETIRNRSDATETGASKGEVQVKLEQETTALNQVGEAESTLPKTPTSEDLAFEKVIVEDNLIVKAPNNLVQGALAEEILGFERKNNRAQEEQASAIAPDPDRPLAETPTNRNSSTDLSARAETEAEISLSTDSFISSELVSSGAEEPMMLQAMPKASSPIFETQELLHSEMELSSSEPVQNGGSERNTESVISPNEQAELLQREVSSTNAGALPQDIRDTLPNSSTALPETAYEKGSSETALQSLLEQTAIAANTDPNLSIQQNETHQTVDKVAEVPEIFSNPEASEFQSDVLSNERSTHDNTSVIPIDAVTSIQGEPLSPISRGIERSSSYKDETPNVFQAELSSPALEEELQNPDVPFSNSLPLHSNVEAGANIVGNVFAPLDEPSLSNQSETSAQTSSFDPEQSAPEEAPGFKFDHSEIEAQTIIQTVADAAFKSSVAPLPSTEQTSQSSLSSSEPLSPNTPSVAEIDSPKTVKDESTDHRESVEISIQGQGNQTESISVEQKTIHDNNACEDAPSEVSSALSEQNVIADSSLETLQKQSLQNESEQSAIASDMSSSQATQHLDAQNVSNDSPRASGNEKRLNHNASNMEGNEPSADEAIESSPPQVPETFILDEPSPLERKTRSQNLRTEVESQSECLTEDNSQLSSESEALEKGFTPQQNHLNQDVQNQNLIPLGLDKRLISSSDTEDPSPEQNEVWVSASGSSFQHPEALADETIAALGQSSESLEKAISSSTINVSTSQASDPLSSGADSEPASSVEPPVNSGQSAVTISQEFEVLQPEIEASTQIQMVANQSSPTSGTGLIKLQSTQQNRERFSLEGNQTEPLSQHVQSHPDVESFASTQHEIVENSENIKTEVIPHLNELPNEMASLSESQSEQDVIAAHIKSELSTQPFVDVNSATDRSSEIPNHHEAVDPNASLEIDEHSTNDISAIPIAQIPLEAITFIQDTPLPIDKSVEQDLAHKVATSNTSQIEQSTSLSKSQVQAAKNLSASPLDNLFFPSDVKGIEVSQETEHLNVSKPDGRAEIPLQLQNKLTAIASDPSQTPKAQAGSTIAPSSTLSTDLLNSEEESPQQSSSNDAFISSNSTPGNLEKQTIIQIIPDVSSPEPTIQKSSHPVMDLSELVQKDRSQDAELKSVTTQDEQVDVIQRDNETNFDTLSQNLPISGNSTLPKSPHGTFYPEPLLQTQPEQNAIATEPKPNLFNQQHKTHPTVDAVSEKAEIEAPDTIKLEEKTIIQDAVSPALQATEQSLDKIETPRPDSLISKSDSMRESPTHWNNIEELINHNSQSLGSVNLKTEPGISSINKSIADSWSSIEDLVDPLSTQLNSQSSSNNSDDVYAGKFPYTWSDLSNLINSLKSTSNEKPSAKSSDFQTEINHKTEEISNNSFHFQEDFSGETHYLPSRDQFIQLVANEIQTRNSFDLQFLSPTKASFGNQEALINSQLRYSASLNFDLIQDAYERMCAHHYSDNVNLIVAKVVESMLRSNQREDEDFSRKHYIIDKF